MPTMPTTALAIHIDGGPSLPGTLEVNQDVITEQTNLPRPNTRWEHTDSAGHYHAHSDDEDDRYPTLSTSAEHVDCDGSCGGQCEGEGYTVTRYACRICGEVIQPGVLDGPHTFRLPGLKHWTVVVVNAAVMPGQVSVRIEADDRMWFGIAERVHFENGPDGTATTLVGVGPLGERKM